MSSIDDMMRKNEEELQKKIDILTVSNGVATNVNESLLNFLFFYSSH